MTAPVRWHRLSLMKRGLYDKTVHEGTMRELALLFHEQRSRHIEYKQTAFQASGDLESPEDTLDKVFEMLLPGQKDSEKDRQAKQAEYLRSLSDVDWSEHLRLDPEIVEKRKRQAEAEEQFGDIAAH